jgi:hypothetical protein
MGFTLQALRFDGTTFGSEFSVTIEIVNKQSLLLRISITGERPNGQASSRYMCGSTVILSGKTDDSVRRLIERIQTLMPAQLDAESDNALTNAVRYWLGETSN